MEWKINFERERETEPTLGGQENHVGRKEEVIEISREEPIIQEEMDKANCGVVLGRLESLLNVQSEKDDSET